MVSTLVLKNFFSDDSLWALISSELRWAFGSEQTAVSQERIKDDIFFSLSLSLYCFISGKSNITV